MFDDSEDDTTQKNGVKRFWNYIKSVKKYTVSIQALNYHGKFVTTGQEKADVPSEQYKSAISKPSQDLITCEKDVLYDPMTDIIISEKGVLKLIHSLKINRAFGLDLNPTRFLKDHAEIIASVLNTISQKSVDIDTTPTDCRSANIVAVLKKGIKPDPTNYSAISLTCVTYKMLGHIIHTQITYHLNANNIHLKLQHGFRSKHRSETQLISCVEDLSRYQDNRE